MPVVQTSDLLKFSRELFEASRVPEAEAEIVARSLVESNLRGHDSHGVLRIPQYLDAIRDGKIRAGVPLETIDETPALLAADGGWGLGQVQAHRLLDRIFPKVEALGVAAGTLRRCGHTGRLGEYAERAAEKGLVFLASVNSHGSGTRVAPPGGTQGRISTNPLCIGAPTNSDPLVLDMGTSVCAEGKVRVAYQKGERVPEGWLLDSEGNPTTDPSVLYVDPRGAIRPLGGEQAYKGFGLGLMLDVLTGGLSGGSCSRPGSPPAVGNTLLFLVLDTARFGGSKHFKREASDLAEFVRACPKAPGVASITLPGDPERNCRVQRDTVGITLPDPVWLMLTKLAAGLNVTVPG